MSDKTSNISTSLRVATQCPLDSKSIFNTFEELADLGDSNNLAFTYYEGMEVFCIETKTFYAWEEIKYGQSGVIEGGFPYPPNSVANGIDYSGRIFNFVVSSREAGALDLFFIEPSVNIEIKNSAENLEHAFHFGTFDIGFGELDYALVKKTFVSQSGYSMLSQENIGDEFKLYNSTNKKYLGHFKLTATEHEDYVLMNIIQKGDWTPEGISFLTQKLIISVLKETNYSIELVGSILTLYRGQAAVGNIDFQGLFAGGGGGAPTSAVLNAQTGIVTFTFSNNTSFNADFSGMLIADDQLKRSGNIAVKGKDIYENLFVLKSNALFHGKGFYAADLTTNYDETTIQGFPYPESRSYVVLLFNGVKYLLIKKTTGALSRIFRNPNGVFALTFYKYKDNVEKSMEFISYLKVVSRKTIIPNLNNDYFALPIHNVLDSTMPFPITSGYFDESKLNQNINEAQAYCMISQVAEEGLPLKRQITVPYTLTEEDHGFVLFVLGNGTLTVPKLRYGFECGLVQESSDVNNIFIAAGTGVSLVKPSSKAATLKGQYESAYIMSNQRYDFGTNIPQEQDKYILLGSLKEN